MAVAFPTQASVNLADDPEMLTIPAAANFTEVFLCLETPSDSSSQVCHKPQNQGRYLPATMRFYTDLSVVRPCRTVRGELNRPGIAGDTDS